MSLARGIFNQTAEKISLRSVELLFFDYFSQLMLQLRNILRCLPLFLFPALAKSMGGRSIALAFLVSDFRRSLHVNRYLNGTLIRVERHHLIRILSH